ncbi:ribosomal protein L36 [Phytophthora cinnamomi]|uniref:ribosomal protein L36 n=1 Tax=Phytophthora cinnamomi TaxID=4785 RepID=UPI0035593A45|nr:ribosomal protein L36 [Phytophthora cinnamomi]
MAKDAAENKPKTATKTSAKWKTEPKRRPKPKAKKNAAAPAAAAAAEEREERPFMVRVLTVGVASYLAHKVWTKRKMLTAGWYAEEQTEAEQGMVTAFEYLSSMGLIFVMGIVVGVIFSKVAKWVKGTAPPAEQ